MSTFTTQIKQLDLTTRREVFTLFIGNYKSAFKGQGIEFNDLRNYIPGDNIKDIDWNSTAKTGNLFVRKYIETREMIVLFAIDTSSSMNWGTSKNSKKKDVVLNSITLLSLAAQQNSDKIGAVLFSDKVEKSIDFKKGRPHMFKILNESNLFFSKSYFKTANLERLLEYLLQGIKKKTICFIFTDGLDTQNPRVKRLIKAANQKHELIFVHIKENLGELEKLGIPMEIQDIETGERFFVDFSKRSVLMNYKTQIEKDEDEIKTFLRRSDIPFLSIDDRSDLLVEFIGLFKSLTIKK